MQDWNRLAHYVLSRRTELGFTTQAAFADALGVVTRTINGFERGESKMRPGTLAKLEKVLQWQPGSAARVLAGGEPMAATEDGLTGTPVTELLRNIALVRKELGEEAARALIRGALTEPVADGTGKNSRPGENSAFG